jgi:hypothetical protein
VIGFLRERTGNELRAPADALQDKPPVLRVARDDIMPPAIVKSQFAGSGSVKNGHAGITGRTGENGWLRRLSLL